MVNLVIDFGNTRTKAAIYEDYELAVKFESIKIEELPIIRSQYDPDQIITSSVSIDPTQVSNIFNHEALILSHTTSLPFELLYDTPETLGLDRIAAIAGSQQHFPAKNCLVIDAGTCITYDIINEDNQYLGGGISPGINMRFKALNTFTARLPLVTIENDVPLIGKSTKGSILTGVINGVIAEIDEIIRMYSDKFADLQIIICGGDAEFFDKKLKASIFAAPDLVLTGLNRILIHNVRKKS